MQADVIASDAGANGPVDAARLGCTHRSGHQVRGFAESGGLQERAGPATRWRARSRSRGLPVSTPGAERCRAETEQRLAENRAVPSGAWQKPSSARKLICTPPGPAWRVRRSWAQSGAFSGLFRLITTPVSGASGLVNGGFQADHSQAVPGCISTLSSQCNHGM
jgi:hypothetical protein